MKKILAIQLKKFKEQLYHLKDNFIVNDAPFVLGESYNDLFYRQESLKSGIEILYKNIVINDLLKQLFSEYGIEVEWQEHNTNNDKNNIEFIIYKNEKRIGYIYRGFIDESTIDLGNVDILYVLDWRSYLRSRTIEQKYTNNKIEYLKVHDFFVSVLSENMYNDFVTYLTCVECEIDDVLGVISVATMSKKNYHLSRLYEDNVLKETVNRLYSYVGIEDDNLDLEEKSKKLLNSRMCKQEFFEKKFDRIFTGENEISRSFLTSEYLYKNYQYVEEFDSTCIVAGYLKSVEQLLYRLCLEHINTGLTIRYNKDKYKNKIKRMTGKEPVCDKKIELNIKNMDYIDSTFDSLVDFLTNRDNYKQTLLCTKKEKTILRECLDAYRQECRNSHFHKDVITRWNKVEIIRNNTIFLYCLLVTLTTHNVYNSDDYFEESFEY